MFQRRILLCHSVRQHVKLSFLLHVLHADSLSRLDEAIGTHDFGSSDGHSDQGRRERGQNVV
jgi:hypothetical protein